MNLHYVRNFAEDNLQNEYTMHLYSPIGTGGISGQAFVNELNFIAGLDEVQTIHIRLNSPGGSVLEGLGIVSAMLECNKTIITYCDGVVASIATQIFLAGDITCMRDTALLMFHNCAGGSQTALAKYNELLNKLYVKRTNQTPEQIKDWMDAETYFSAEEAQAYGLTDQVFETETKVRREEVAAHGADVEALYALYTTNLATEPGAERLETTKNNNDDMIQDKLIELFNLEAGVAPETVVEQVQNVLDQVAIINELQETKASLEEQVSNALGEVEQVKNLLVEKDTEITNLSALVETKENLVITLTNQVNEFEADAVKRQDEKISNLIENAITANKITPADKDNWLFVANTDYARAEQLLNGLRPVRNKLSKKINEVSNTEIDSFAAEIQKVKRKIQK